MLSKLLNWTVQMVGWAETNMVLKKMCSTLATYFIRSPVLWERPLFHLAFCFVSGGWVEDPAPKDFEQAFAGILPRLSTQQSVVLMWFAATLAEDVAKVDSSTPANNRIHSQMESIVRELQPILLFAFDQRPAPDRTSLKQQATKCFGSWTNYAQPMWPQRPGALSRLQSLVRYTLKCTEDPDESDEDSLEALRDLLESYTSFFLPAHMEYFADIIRGYMHPILEQAVADKDADGEPYGRFVAAYGSANIKNVINDHMTGGRSGIVVDLVLGFLASDGYPGDDLFLSFGNIEFLNTYIEFVNDEVFSADVDEAPTAWEMHVRGVAKRVVELVWRKLWTPPAEVAKGWREEEREMFKE